MPSRRPGPRPARDGNAEREPVPLPDSVDRIVAEWAGERPERVAYNAQPGAGPGNHDARSCVCRAYAPDPERAAQ